MQVKNGFVALEEQAVRSGAMMKASQSTHLEYSKLYINN